MGKTTVDGLDKAVDEALDSFYGACITDIQEAAKIAAKQAVKDLRAKSPKGRSGEYAKGWTSMQKKTRTGVTATVYNKDRYMIAHLLEYGHAKVNGGRTAAQVHIAPIEKSAGDKFADELTRRIESGS